MHRDGEMLDLKWLSQIWIDIIVRFLILWLKRFYLSEWENTSSSSLIVRSTRNHLSAVASSGHNLQLKLKSTFSAALSPVCDMHRDPSGVLKYNSHGINSENQQNDWNPNILEPRMLKWKE